MAVPAKAAPQAKQSQQRWQWRSDSSSKGGSIGGSTGEGGSVSKGGSARKLGSTSKAATV
jgi:hypothetical protein